MDITRTFKPEALQEEELIEVLAALLREESDSGGDAATLAATPSAVPAQRDFPDLLSGAP